MHANLDPQAFAAEILRAQDRCLALAPFAARSDGFDDAFGYQVAARIHAERLAQGWTPLGRKIGFTNPAIWDEYGVREPIWGHVYDRTLLRLAPGAAARCALGGFREPRIEPEIVLHLGSAPRAAADPRELLACIDWIAHGFEIVQSHFPGWKFARADAIADSALHGMLVVGEPQPLARLGGHVAEDLERFAVVLARDGLERDRGSGANVLGSPLAALAHLLAVLAREPAAALAAGEIVTTGTLTAALPIRPGERWSTRVEGIALPGCALECAR